MRHSHICLPINLAFEDNKSFQSSKKLTKKKNRNSPITGSLEQKKKNYDSVLKYININRNNLFFNYFHVRMYVIQGDRWMEILSHNK